MTQLAREAALAEFKERKAHPPKRVRDEDLYAGSPMHFYCQSCGHLAGTLPEDYDPSVTPPPRQCPDCRSMIVNGWLDGLD